MKHLESDIANNLPEIAVLVVPTEVAQEVLDRIARAGIKAVLNFAPVQLHAPADIAVKTVNMAMELEGLTSALISTISSESFCDSRSSGHELLR